MNISTMKVESMHSHHQEAVAAASLPASQIEFSDRAMFMISTIRCYIVYSIKYIPHLSGMVFSSIQGLWSKSGPQIHLFFFSCFLESATQRGERGTKDLGQKNGSENEWVVGEVKCAPAVYIFLKGTN